MKTVAVIGGGPAGLMAAETLVGGGVQVNLYEAKPSVGRKFLVAGKGGLNLTHSEAFETFAARFGPQPEQIRPFLEAFKPDNVREWSSGLGIETFVGFSKRVFPTDMKATPLLQRWVARLRDGGVRFHTGHRWEGWNRDRTLRFRTREGEISVAPDAAVLALGGASWPKLGSDGAWVPILGEENIEVTSLRPSNCGFDVSWSDHFRERYAGEPLKSVGLSFVDSTGQTFQRRGSCVVTSNGLEGSLIYAASSLLRDEIERTGSATITLDLTPDRPLEKLIERLSQPRGSRTFSKHLKSKAKVYGVQAGLLREVAPESLAHPIRLSEAIKALPVSLVATRPVEESISTAGGIALAELDESLMIRRSPGLFCAGEMLNWEAPTGGYLLTACLATGLVAGNGAKEWLCRHSG